MANLSCKVEVSGLEIVNKVLKNMQEKICFTDDVADDYKKGFNDCLNAIISAMEQKEQEERDADN